MVDERARFGLVAPAREIAGYGLRVNLRQVEARR